MKRLMFFAAFLVVGALVMSSGVSAANRQNVTITTESGMRFSMAVITPAIWTPNTPLPVIFALPPGGGDMSMVNAFLRNYWLEEADRRGYIIVSPAVLGRSLEDTAGEVLDAAFRWLDGNVSYDYERMALVGQSNGGLGAFHVVRERPEWFTSVVVMPGGYGGQGDLDMLAGKPVLLTVGEQDTSWVQLSQNTRDLLLLADAHPEIDVVPGGGHVFPYPPEDLFNWIEQSFPE
jgi:predicted esterase